MARTVLALASLLLGPSMVWAQQGAPPSEGGGGPASGGPGTPGVQPAPPAGDPGSAMDVMVVDAATYGIDPVVGEHVTHRVRETAASMGYAVLDREATVAAARSAGMAYPPTPADLWRAGYAAGAERALFARVWADASRYVIEIVVASLDGSGPFFARGTAGAADLHAVVAGLVEQALPPPGRWDAEQAARWRSQAAQAPASEEPAPGAEPEGDEPAADWGEPAAEEHPPAPVHRVHVALQTEGVIGTSDDGFYNHLLGVRFGILLGADTSLMAYLAYANLTGRNGRASNLLPMVMVEHRVRVTEGRGLSLPLRLGLGYLPYNGPVVRLSAGVNIPLSERVELGFDLLAPTFWVLPDETAVALDLAAEIVFRL